MSDDQHRRVRVSEVHFLGGDYAVQGEVYGNAYPFDPDAETQRVQVTVGIGTILLTVPTECVTVVEREVVA